jgi:hypothetical protein
MDAGEMKQYICEVFDGVKAVGALVGGDHGVEDEVFERVRG